MKTNNKSAARLRSSDGFTIIELLIVLAITAVAAIVGAQKIKAYFLDQQAQQRADTISVLGKATANYVSKKRTTFPAGFTDISLLKQLRDDGGLSANFGSLATGATPYAMGYAIRVYSDANCSVGPCNITAWVYSVSSWVVDGKVRLDLVGNAVNKVGIPGGMNLNTATPLPGYTNGAVGKGGAGWALLATAFPAATGYPYSAAGGQLFYNATVFPLDDASFLRVDGSNKMNGPLNMGTAGAGQSILMNSGNLLMSAGNIVNATGITTGTVTATGDLMGGSITTTGQTPVAGNVTAGSAVTAGTAITAGTTVTAVGDVMGGSITTTGQTAVAGNVTARNGVSAGTTVTAAGDIMGASITTTGMTPVVGNVTAQKDVTIDDLKIRDATPLPTSLLALAPRLVEMTNYAIDTGTLIPSQPPYNATMGTTTYGGVAYNIVDGTRIPAQACTGTGGTSNIFVIPAKTTGTTTGGYFGVTAIAGKNGDGSWTLNVKDANGAAVPSNDVRNFGAVVRVFCSY